MRFARRTYIPLHLMASATCTRNKCPGFQVWAFRKEVSCRARWTELPSGFANLADYLIRICFLNSLPVDAVSRARCSACRSKQEAESSTMIGLTWQDVFRSSSHPGTRVLSHCTIILGMQDLCSIISSLLDFRYCRSSALAMR